MTSNNIYKDDHMVREYINDVNTSMDKQINLRIFF